MMVSPELRKSNSGLLSFSEVDKRTEHAMSFTNTIAVERPLRTPDEARMSSFAVNNVLAFVEYGLSYHDGLPIDTEAALEGLAEIIQACRLVSLRVEQYLDLQEEKKI